MRLWIVNFVSFKLAIEKHYKKMQNRHIPVQPTYYFFSETDDPYRLTLLSLSYPTKYGTLNIT